MPISCINYYRQDGYRVECTKGPYDIHGNVWELCLDWLGNYPSGIATDPTGASSGSVRVLHGGSCSRDADNCRSAERGGNGPSSQAFDIGFRVVLFR